MKRKKKFIISSVLFIGFLIVIYLYFAVSILSFGNARSTMKADAAIVLGAAVWSNRPSPVFKERINHAIWLYKNKSIKKIIFTGASDSRNESPESVIARGYAVKKSVPLRDILIETKSTTTQENLYYALELARKNKLDSFLIVSDPLHMKRAMLIADDYDMKAHQSPTLTTRYRTWNSKLQFLSREVYYYSTYLLYRLLN